MSRHALTLVAEENAIQAAPSTVTAMITVTSGPEGLSFTSSNPRVVVQGTDITLKPASSTAMPVTYNLVFEAGAGIASFQTPSAEIPLEGTSAAFNVNPNSTTSFSMTFHNDLPVGSSKVSISFFVNWNSALLEILRSEDPTIILEAPNS